MLEKYQWNDKYLVNHDDIDLQHRFFVNLIGKLHNELKNNNDKNYLNRLISELNAYARFHFISEENMMIKTNYPDLELHKRHHEELLDKLVSKETLLELEDTPEMAEELIEFLFNWFVHHSLNEDKRFCDFIK